MSYDPRDSNKQDIVRAVESILGKEIDGYGDKGSSIEIDFSTEDFDKIVTAMRDPKYRWLKRLSFIVSYEHSIIFDAD